MALIGESMGQQHSQQRMRPIAPAGYTCVSPPTERYRNMLNPLKETDLIWDDEQGWIHPSFKHAALSVDIAEYFAVARKL